MRELNSVERAWHTIGQHGSANAVRSFRIRGPLTHTLADQAFEGVLRVYPILRCRILENPADRRLCFREHPVWPRVRCCRFDDAPPSPSYLAALAEDLLNRPIQPDREPVLDFVFLQGPADEHWVLVNFHHAISDGMTMVAVMGCFLRLCDAALLGEDSYREVLEQEQAKGDLSPSLTACFARDGLVHQATAALRFAGRRMLQEARYRALKPGPAPAHSARGARAGHTVPRCRVYETHIAAEWAERLRSRARTLGLTFNAVFTAALLRAVKRTLFPQRSRANISCVTFVNLRSRCKPEVPLDAVGCYISAAFSFHAMNQLQPLLDIARDYRQQLAAASEEDVFVQARAANVMTRTLFALRRTTAATLSVSNVGQVANRLASRSFEVMEIHVHSALSGVGSTISVGLTMTRQRLSFDATYLEGVVAESDVRAVVTATLQELDQFEACEFGAGSVPTSEYRRAKGQVEQHVQL